MAIASSDLLLQKARQFIDVFAGLPHAWGALHGECIKEELTLKHVANHLKGTESLGIYPIFDKKLIRWSAVDFDFKKEPDRVSLSEKHAREFADALFEIGIKCCWFERSKSGLIHLWLLFQEPVLASKVRYILRCTAKRLGLKIANGIVEIFPKHDELTDDTTYGNYINLPYFGALNGTQTGARTMLDSNSFAPIRFDEFLSRAEQTLISPIELDAVFESLAEEEAQEEPTDEMSSGSSQPNDNKESYSEANWQIKKEKVKSILTGYWKEPDRNSLTYHVSDLMCRRGITLGDAKNLFLELAKGCKDKEWKQRITVAEHTYKKRESGERTNYKDIKKILSAEDYEELTRLFSKSTSTEVKLLVVADYELTPRKWHIENAFPEAHTTLVYAEGGVAKSYFGEYASILSAIGGRNFLGLAFSDAPKNVLYLDYELDFEEFKRRAHEITAGLEEDTTVPRNLLYYFPEQSLPKFLPTLNVLIKKNDIQFLVIDSLGAAGVDPDKAVEVIAAFARLRTLGVTTLILDHQPKMQAQDNYNLKTPYGSVYKYNLSRSVFQLACIHRQPGLMSVMLRHKKSNFGKLLDDLLFDIEFNQIEGKVRFLRSDSLSPELKDVIMIRDLMVELDEKGEKVNQLAIIEGLRKALSKEKTIRYLDEYEGRYWDLQKGLKNEYLYKVRG